MIREQVKALWRLCFDDDEAFIEMYFRLRYSNNVNIAISSGEEVIAALQMLPYPMTFCGETIQTSYISGACTHPDYQGNGVMRELLSQAFAQMLHNGTSVSTLIPGEAWLFNYYARMGYAPVFRYSKELLPEDNAISSTNITVERTIEFKETVYEYLNRRMEERSCCIQHTAADFRIILADLSMAQDALYVAREEDKVVGIAIVYREESTLRMDEFFADSEEAKQQLLSQIRQETGCDAITLTAPPASNAETNPLGMARIINAKSVLQLYAAAYPDNEMSIELTDKQLSINNGYYYLYKGKCMYNKQRLPGTHITLTIAALSEKILAPLRPYMSLMLN